MTWLSLIFGGVNILGKQLAEAHARVLAARNDTDRIAAEIDTKRIEAAMHAMNAANADRWSATSIGRYLVVLPFGLWYSAIMLDSIFVFEWDVLALPDRIMSLSEWLFPAVIVGDVGKFIFRRRA